LPYKDANIRLLLRSNATSALLRSHFYSNRG